MRTPHQVNIDYECPCGETTSVEFTPGCPAKTNCRPEDSYPEEPDSIIPDDCPNCEEPIPLDEIGESADSIIADGKDQTP